MALLPRYKLVLFLLLILPTQVYGQEQSDVRSSESATAEFKRWRDWQRSLESSTVRGEKFRTSATREVPVFADAFSPVLTNQQATTSHYLNNGSNENYSLNFNVQVTDPQGLADISSVIVTGPTGKTYRLTSYNNDGFYSAGASSQTELPVLGVYKFRATDKSGNWTETIDSATAILSYPANAQPKHGAFVATATPTFSWSPVSGATYYYVYVNRANGGQIWSKNNVTSNSCVFNDDGSASETLKDGSSYSWSVSASDKDGNSGSVYNLFSYSTNVASPILSGANAYTAHQMDPYGNESYTINFNVRVSDPQGLSDIASVVVTGPKGTSYSLSGSGDGYYYGNSTSSTELPVLGAYTFRATDKSGNWTESVSSATAVLDYPRNVRPAPGEFVATATPTFSWNAVAGATSYYMSVFLANGPQIWYKNGPTLTSATFNSDGAASDSLVEGNSYGWNINASDAQGNYGSWNSITFTYSRNTAAPTLANPMAYSGHSLYSYGENFNLQLSVQVADPQGLSDITSVTASGPDGTAYTLTSWNNDGWYSYGVSNPTNNVRLGAYKFRATDKSGNWTEKIDTVTTVLGYPKNIHPAKNEFISTASPTLSWDAVPGVSSYSIWVSRSNGNQIWNRSGLTKTSVAFNDDGQASEAIKEGYTYTWSVVAHDLNSNYGACYESPFTYSSNKVAPVITNPMATSSHTIDGNGYENYTLNLNVQVADPQGQSDLASVVVVTPNGKTYTLTSPNNDGRYYYGVGGPTELPQLGPYRFRAADKSGNLTEAVDTLTAVLDCPRNAAPKHNEIVASGTPTFSWSPVAGATSYYLTVRRSTGQQIWYRGGLTSTSVTYNDDKRASESLIDGGKYAWDLNAQDSKNTSSQYGFNIYYRTGNRRTIFVDSSNVAGNKLGTITNPFSTIADGVGSAMSGDTVIVAAGTYDAIISDLGSITLLGKNPLTTKIRGTLTLRSSKATIKGLQIIESGSNGIEIYRNVAANIQGNVIARNYGAGIVCMDSGASATIINNTIVYNGQYGVDVRASGSSATLVNNIVAFNSGGISATTSTAAQSSYDLVSLNDFFSTGKNYNNALPGTTDLSAIPVFISSERKDYRLDPSSPCVDAGDPDLNRNGVTWKSDPGDRDPDGTRLDIGGLFFDQRLYLPAAPKNLSAIPSNNTVVLMWSSNSEFNLSYYKLYRSTSHGFIPAAKDSIGVVARPDTMYVDRTVVAGQAYYYRVAAVTAVGNEGPRSDEANTYAIQLPTPILAMPSDGATKQPLSPTLIWNPAATAQSYSLQIALDRNFTTIVVNDTGITGLSRLVGPLSGDTVYYWRVYAKNDAGISPFSSVWSFRTVTAPPAAVTLLSVADGASGVAANPILSWKAAVGATNYHLQVSRNVSFNDLVVDDTTITATSRQLSSLQTNTTYYWRVRGKNAGGYGSYSIIWSFTTISPLPLAVVLSSPADSTLGLSTSPVLRWTSATYATGYHLQIATDAAFAAIAFEDSTLTSLSQQVTSLHNSTSYFWRVRGKSSSGYGPYSPTWTFTTIMAVPAAGVLQSPSNASTGVATTIILTWSNIAAAETYHLQVSTDVNFSSTIVDDTSGTNTLKQLGPLQNNTTYYWRVRGKNAGGYGTFSPTWSFTTIMARPAAITLVSPVDGAVGVPVDVQLGWLTAAGASVYHVELAVSASFSALLFEDTTSVTNSRQLSGLQNSATYYWRIHGRNAAGDGPYSPIWSFSTIIAVPSAANLLAPANNSTDNSNTPTVSWAPIATATAYCLQVSQDVNFSTFLINDTTLTTTSRQIGPLQNNVSYFWRARGKNAGGFGAFSPTWSFKTIVALPAAVVLNSPGDNTGSISTSPLLRWSLVNLATEYHLQVSTSASFGNMVFEDSSLTGNQQQLNALQNSTNYFWRVRAKNTAGYGPYSPVWSFTTVVAAPASAVLVSPLNSAAGVSIATTLSWSTLSTATSYHLQVSTDVGFASLVFSDTTLTGTSKQIGPLQNNTMYQWRVRGKNAGGYGLYSPTWSFTTIPVYTPTVSVSTSLGFSTRAKASDYTPTDYKLFGLPGGSNLPVDSVFTGRENFDWQVYWDDGSSSNYMKKYDGSVTFRFTQGRGFWVIAKNAVNVSRTLTAATLNNNQEVEIPLQSGWNLITNPFNASTQWSKIQTINGTTAPLYAFSGVFNTSSAFDPYSGYYLFNGSPNPVLNVLRVPYASLFTKMEETPANEGSGWRIQIQAGDSRVEIGVDADAKLGMDAYDERMPRAVGEISQVSLAREEWDKDYPSFRTDIRPQVNSIEKWNIELAAKANTTAQITVKGIETIPNQYEVYLVDQEGKRSQDLRKMQTYNCDVQSSKREISIIVGNSDLVRSEAEKNLPTDIKVGPNYPNPFNPETIIPIELPKAMDVKIVIYDILGRTIRTLYDGMMESGRHFVRWDGKDAGGAPTASGIYLYQMQTTNGMRSAHKIMLLR